MISFLIRTFVNAVALWLIAHQSNGQIEVKNEGAALVAAVVLCLANAVVRPIIYGVAKTATFALSCITLGLWGLVLSMLINALMLYLVGVVLDDFTVKGFWAAFLGALVLSCVNTLLTALLPHKNKDKNKNK